MSLQDTTAVVLADLGLIAVVSHLVGALFRRIGQPAVIGEISAGIAFGPTLLGRTVPGAPEWLFPDAARAHLGVLAQVGLVLFMFGVGLEVDTGQLLRLRRTAVVVASASALVPFALGALLAPALFAAHAGKHGDALSFTLFLGTAMSATALPVLARILGDRGMSGTRIGGLALTCAAVNDVAAWAVLAAVVAYTQSDGSGNLTTIAIGCAVLALVVFGIARPVLRAVLRRARASGDVSAGAFVAVVAGALVSGGITSAVGLHAIFGAFAYGVAFPRADAAEFAAEIGRRLEPIVHRVLLPVFFVVAGLGVDAAALTGVEWLQFVLVLAAACGGKLGGVTGAARLVGARPREALALGALMNARGLTELVILTVGLQLGVIDSSLFTMFVLMALVTTAMSGPLLNRLIDRGRSRPTTGDRVVVAVRTRETS